MKGMISQFVLFFFLLLLMWTGVLYVTQNIQYSSAKRFHSNVVEQLENSYFNEKVREECQEKARENGYQLTVEEYGEKGNRDARVVLEFSFTIPVLKKTKQYKIEGYAR